MERSRRQPETSRARIRTRGKRFSWRTPLKKVVHWVALGAQPPGILRLVIERSARPILVGLALGWAAAFGLTRLMSNLLYGAQPTDLVTFGLVSGVLMAVGLLASYLPARRATQLDPMLALRYE